MPTDNRQMLFWQSSLLANYPDIYHGSAELQNGIMRYGSADYYTVMQNRFTLAYKCGFAAHSAVLMEQIHANRVAVVNKTHAGAGLFSNASRVTRTDGLVCREQGLPLIVRTADCVPLLFYDPVNKIPGAAHAGWRGTLGNVAGNVVGKMEAAFGSDPGDIIVVIGPCICGHHYDVTGVSDNRVKDFQRLFGNDSDVVYEEQNRIGIDLARANRLLCLQAGVNEEHIEVSPVCTYEPGNAWPSYRGGDKHCQRQIWTYITKLDSDKTQFHNK